MVHIEKLDHSHIELIKQISVADEQVKFAGTAEDFLSDSTDTTHLHVIKNNNAVVGFFKLDIAYSFNHDFCSQNGLGLRAFVIGIDYQGKGIGKSAVKALFPYLKENYPDFDTIYLTVNCKNPNAQRCYTNGGFEDTGEKYMVGAAGPQHIMRAKIA
ncbi:TPA: GNAT family N-acetyltransferase [Vibrio parahaemolyticus]|nr:GNAT family N-acetyltransferase [Vibrio parahaemolyticus]HCM1486617.1 GNAT family N-acetyltransferase [Vibrio parahaemolyticus]